MAKVRGFGTKFQYTTDSGSTWTDVAQITNITPPTPSKGTVDVTDHDSTSGHREFEGTLVDGGEASIEVFFDPANAGHQLLMTRANTAHETPQDYRVVQVDTGATIIEFSATCTGYAPGVPLDGKLTQSYTFKVSGTIDNDATA